MISMLFIIHNSVIMQKKIYEDNRPRLQPHREKMQTLRQAGN